MKKIADLVDNINEELEDAKNYAEKYLECKASGSLWANKFLEMSNDELKHADQIHAYAVEEIQQLKAVYVPPVEMVKVWEESHARFVERTAWIKQMLAM